MTLAQYNLPPSGSPDVNFREAVSEIVTALESLETQPAEEQRKTLESFPHLFEILDLYAPHTHEAIREKACKIAECCQRELRATAERIGDGEYPPEKDKALLPIVQQWSRFSAELRNHTDRGGFTKAS